MATATETKTAAPRRGRAAAKPAATPKSAPADVEAASEAPTVSRFTVDLEQRDDTKSYAVFAFPANYVGVAVGKVYVPKGTVKVKVLIVGDTDTEE